MKEEKKSCGKSCKCGCNESKTAKKDVGNGWAETQEQKQDWSKDKK